VLDSGPCHIGIESTVLDLSGAQPFLLRPGGATVEAIEALIGPVGRGIPHAVAEAARTLRSPGLMVSHYAPAAPVRLNADMVRGDEALLAYGLPPEGAGAVFQLSASQDLTEAAANLFTGLRELDTRAAQLDLSGIAVMPIPEQGLGLAINDRLRRAAAPRG